MSTSEPKHLSIARQLIGVREVPGPSNSSRIMGWAQKLGARVLGIAYGADSVPWCGLFAAYVVAEAGLKPPAIAIRAKAWATWGTPLSAAIPGSVLVFSRDGGGHVGFAVGHDIGHYLVLGGNQGDAVSIARIAKSRCIAIRWPAGVPMTGTLPLVAVAGPVSRNEA